MDPTTPNDADLIVRSLDESHAFATVYDRHAGVVHRFLVRRVGPHVAEDLLAETFSIAFQKRDGFDTSRPSARPWLYGIATNLVARHRRSEARRLAAMERIRNRTIAAPTTGDDAIARVDAGAVWPDLVARIDALPAAERDAVILYAWEELSYEEIALALDVPVGTVRSRLNRARRRLREPDLPIGEEHHSTGMRPDGGTP